MSDGYKYFEGKIKEIKKWKKFIIYLCTVKCQKFKN